MKRKASLKQAVSSGSRTDRYSVSAEQYRAFRRDGFLVVPDLVSAEEVGELRRHTEDLMQGRLPEQQNSNGAGPLLEAPPEHLSEVDKAQFFLRIHMLHRVLALHERYMLQPRVLDVLEAIIGPDVLALQTMLFLKPPGKPGQGWHQDRFYIPTHPDTLCGAWICIDDCDEINGAMWMALGSHIEPVYPPPAGYGYGYHALSGASPVAGVSDPDDDHNQLSPIAAKYPQVLVTARAGDVVFFHGHVIHRSKMNYSTDRFRRSFVSHYCNARSFTQWGPDQHGVHDNLPENGAANGSHILARGDTHLTFAQPRFGTPCAALLSSDERTAQSRYVASMVANIVGDMETAPHDPTITDDDE